MGMQWGVGPGMQRLPDLDSGQHKGLWAELVPRVGTRVEGVRL